MDNSNDPYFIPNNYADDSLFYENCEAIDQKDTIDKEIEIKKDENKHISYIFAVMILPINTKCHEAFG